MDIKYDRDFIQRWYDSVMDELEMLYMKKTSVIDSCSFEDASELNTLIYRKKEEAHHLRFALENLCA